MWAANASSSSPPISLMARRGEIRFHLTRRSYLKLSCSASSNRRTGFRFAQSHHTSVNKLRLIIAASFRSQLRWASEHIYYWLVLGPVVIGFTTFTVARVVGN